MSCSASSSARDAPSSEEVAARLGFDPLDTGPLVAELSGFGSPTPDRADAFPNFPLPIGVTALDAVRPELDGCAPRRSFQHLNRVSGFSLTHAPLEEEHAAVVHGGRCSS